jgi:hypothetical protein
VTSQFTREDKYAAHPDDLAATSLSDAHLHVGALPVRSLQRPAGRGTAMFRSMFRDVSVGLALALVTPTASAQEAGRPRDTVVSLASARTVPSAPTERRASNCNDAVQPSLDYGQCALWLDGNRLRRGRAGETLARTGFFHPIPLQAHLIGDSARAYARSYERLSRRASALAITGVALSVAAGVVMQSYECRPVQPFGACSTGDDGYWMASGALLLGSLGFSIASMPVRLRALRYGSQAVLWHNERFAR